MILYHDLPAKISVFLVLGVFSVSLANAQSNETFAECSPIIEGDNARTEINCDTRSSREFQYAMLGFYRNLQHGASLRDIQQRHPQHTSRPSDRFNFRLPSQGGTSAADRAANQTLTFSDIIRFGGHEFRPSAQFTNGQLDEVQLNMVGRGSGRSGCQQIATQVADFLRANYAVPPVPFDDTKMNHAGIYKSGYIFPFDNLYLQVYHYTWPDGCEYTVIMQ